MRQIARVIGAVVMAVGIATPLVAATQKSEAPVCPRHEGGAGYLGIMVEDREAPEGKDAKTEAAVLVREVQPDTPAAKAGLLRGDGIVRFDGERVRSSAQFSRLVRETPPGRRVGMEVVRAGSARTLSVTVGEGHGPAGPWEEWGRELGDRLREIPERLPEDLPGLDVFEGRPGRLGIRYEEIDGQLARYFHLEREHGVLVTEVIADSPAEKAGVKAGDVLLAVNGRDVEDGHDLRRAISGAEDGATLAVKVLREGKAVDLTVSLKKRSAPEHAEHT